MAYCWDVYQKSECQACTFFKTFQSGDYDLKKIKDVILVDDSEVHLPKEENKELSSPQ